MLNNIHLKKPKKKKKTQASLISEQLTYEKFHPDENVQQRKLTY